MLKDKVDEKYTIEARGGEALEAFIRALRMAVGNKVYVNYPHLKEGACEVTHKGN